MALAQGVPQFRQNIFITRCQYQLAASQNSPMGTLSVHIWSIPNSTSMPVLTIDIPNGPMPILPISTRRTPNRPIKKLSHCQLVTSEIILHHRNVKVSSVKPEFDLGSACPDEWSGCHTESTLSVPLRAPAVGAATCRAHVRRRWLCLAVDPSLRGHARLIGACWQRHAIRSPVAVHIAPWDLRSSQYKTTLRTTHAMEDLQKKITNGGTDAKPHLKQLLLQPRNSAGKQDGVKKPPSPPDGGWGWVVVFACSVSFFVAGGFGRSFTLIYQELITKFGQSASSTATVAAVFGAVKLCSSEYAC